MKNAFQPVPLLVAAVVGALLLYLVSGFVNSQNGVNTAPAAPNYLLLGALTGLGVQIGVRLVGVS
jgi:hypothetical protein